jgi:predicted glycosyltransferase
MNILATRVPAIIWPYPGDREQGIRAESLAAIGAATVLKEKDLQPNRMFEIIKQRLYHSGKANYQVDLQGAANTAEWIQRQE